MQTTLIIFSKVAKAQQVLADNTRLYSRLEKEEDGVYRLPEIDGNDKEQVTENVQLVIDLMQLLKAARITEFIFETPSIKKNN